MIRVRVTDEIKVGECTLARCPLPLWSGHIVTRSQASCLKFIPMMLGGLAFSVRLFLQLHIALLMRARVLLTLQSP